MCCNNYSITCIYCSNFIITCICNNFKGRHLGVKCATALRSLGLSQNMRAIYENLLWT